MLFTNQIAVITGSTRGIGKEIAHSFAREGATAVILGRSEEAALKVSQEFNRRGFQSVGMDCDVTSLASVQKTFNKILDKYKRIDILVNNAGITKDNLLLRLSETDWDDVLKVNLNGVYSCTKMAVKAMLKAQKGKIINIASVIGITGNSGQANYAASKAGIIGFTKSIAKEIASRGITVNAVAPGYITTDMTEKLNEKTKEQVLKQIPLGRLGTAADVANVCVFLASPDADYITGQTIVVDGGLAI